jgi:hypothetical protein
VALRNAWGDTEAYQKKRIHGRGIMLKKYPPPPQKREAETWYVFFYGLLDFVEVRGSIHALRFNRSDSMYLRSI